ncbi:hypothetical protein ES288_D03G020900v1 [Gossypium darwinii]|uniref:TF-B3 domain-containing protein n=1 Tax=Gossypium darwinii TaxID=34276 RepID=A0A5D2D4T9_GOSDA|nr:hypothetical protein ES288_D03G020900v1 [Gossypium darwinii]
MASSSYRQGNDHLKFISNSPHFFKIILQDTIQNGKLGVPRKFVKNQGNSMSSPAMLSVPSGEVWKVELTKCNGKIWFENGWLEFSNHYSLDFGHLLVFRYDGNSNFHDISTSRKLREKSQMPCPQPCKMMHSTNSAIKTEIECDGKSEFLAQQIRYEGCPARNGDKSTRHRVIQQLKPHEKDDALERASKTFKSENPFFLVVMQPSYVGLSHSKGYRLAIPANFVRKHLMKELCSITLCNSSGKTWIVTFKNNQIGKKQTSYLLTGWGTFVHDNNIRVGDACAFELINSIEISFNVAIYQGPHTKCYQSLSSTDIIRPMKRKDQSYASPSGSETLTALEKAKAFQVASAFKSEYPFFISVLQPSYSRRMNIPVIFARKYLAKMHKEAILLLSNGKSWPVIYCQHKIESTGANAIFSSGWRRFSHDNKLEVGDSCVFELIMAAETSMKVTIYKKQAVKDSSLADNSREKQVELHEISVIGTKSALMNEKEDTSNLLLDYNCDASGETLDDILISNLSSPGRALEEASQSYQSFTRE